MTLLLKLLKLQYNLIYRVSLILLMALFSTNSYAQNLVLNGSFEEFSIPDKYMMYSETKISGTDSIFFKKFKFSIVNAVGWGNVQYTQINNIAKSGSTYKEITIFNKVLYEDNIYYYSNAQGRLCKSLIKDNEYQVELFIKPMKGDFYSNKLEILLLDTIDENLIHKEFIIQKTKKTYFNTEPNKYLPSYSHTDIISDTLKFEKISFIYKSTGGEKYIYIGNITGSYPNELIKVKKFGNQFSKYGRNGRFMIIDDISITPLDTNEILCSIPVLSDTFTKKPVDLNIKDTLLIHQEFYEVNNDITNYNEIILNKLKSSNIESIIIKGYTDLTYKSEYNLKLAKRRAENYKTYLLKNEISCDINTISKGAVLDGDFDNSRRIDIYIIKK